MECTSSSRREQRRGTSEPGREAKAFMEPLQPCARDGADDAPAVDTADPRVAGGADEDGPVEGVDGDAGRQVQLRVDRRRAVPCPALPPAPREGSDLPRGVDPPDAVGRLVGDEEAPIGVRGEADRLVELRRRREAAVAGGADPPGAGDAIHFYTHARSCTRLPCPALTCACRGEVDRADTAVESVGDDELPAEHQQPERATEPRRGGGPAVAGHLGHRTERTSENGYLIIGTFIGRLRSGDLAGLAGLAGVAGLQPLGAGLS
eukprot:gene1433-biopygen3491